MRKPLPMRFLVCIGFCLLACTSIATESTGTVIKAIEARDCPAAVRELNAALAKGTPEAMLLGGAMFEQGLCLKPNVERAARLYQRAADAGSVVAPSRLAAMYASPLAGPDRGSAIWWALRAGLQLPTACVVAADLRNDVDKFAAALVGWPAGLLDACVHVSGVLAALDAEFVLDSQASATHAITIDFVPATGGLKVNYVPQSQLFSDNSPRVVVTNNVVGANNVVQSATPEQLRLQQESEGMNAMAKHVEKVATDALERFPRPSSIDATWRIHLRVNQSRTR